MVNHHLKCPMDWLLQMDFQNVKSLVLGLQVLIGQQLVQNKRHLNVLKALRGFPTFGNSQPRLLLRRHVVLAGYRNYESGYDLSPR